MSDKVPGTNLKIEMHQSETHLLMTGMTVHALVKRLQLLMIRYAWAAFVSRIDSSWIPLSDMYILETTDRQT